MCPSPTGRNLFANFDVTNLSQSKPGGVCGHVRTVFFEHQFGTHEEIMTLV